MLLMTLALTLCSPIQAQETTQPVFTLATPFVQYPVGFQPGGDGIVDTTRNPMVPRSAFLGADPSLVYNSLLANSTNPILRQFGHQYWYTDQVYDTASGALVTGIGWAYTSTLGDAVPGQDFVKHRTTQGAGQPFAVVAPSLAPGTWDEHAIETSSALEVPGLPGYYFLFHAGRQDSYPQSTSGLICKNATNQSGVVHRYQIGLAIGQVGTPFDKNFLGFNPQLQPIIPAGSAAAIPNTANPSADTWDGFLPKASCTLSGTLEPTVIVNPSNPNELLMWYSGYDSASGKYKIGHAVCPDITKPYDWMKMGPVFEGTYPWEAGIVSQVNVIADPVKGFHMFYYGHSAVGGCGTKIGHAYSADGMSWTQRAVPISSPWSPTCGQLFDRIGGPTAYIKNGRIEINYMLGSSGSQFRDPLNKRFHSN